MKKLSSFSPAGKTAWHVSWIFWSVASHGNGSNSGTMILTEGTRTEKWTGPSHRPMSEPFLSIWDLSSVHLGASTAMCIFSLPKHWAGIRELFPDWVSAVESDERILGFTLDNKMTLAEYIGDAVSCVCHDAPKALFQFTSGVFSLNDVEQSERVLPAGAFHGAEGGPC